MEIFKSNPIKTSTTSQQKSSAGARASAPAKLRLLESPATATNCPEKPPSTAPYLAVRFNHSLHAVKDTLAQQPVQPMMVRNLLDTAKQQIIAQPNLTILAQANSATETVAALLV